MKFKEGQVVYVRDEHSLAVVNNPCTDKGNVTLVFYPSLTRPETCSDTDCQDHGVVLRDDNGLAYIEFASGRWKDYRGMGMTWNSNYRISTLSQLHYHMGYRALPVNSPLIHAVPQEDAALFLHNIDLAWEVVEAVQKKNKTSQYEKSSVRKYLDEDFEYLKAARNELQK